MRQEIELFLGGQSVEFNEPPQILFSYIRTDYTDPTVLRNSYSKTLTIEGTPNNNQIFNSIYHLDQIVDPSTFNPSMRMSFQLFSNGDILEQGYAKLDKINKDEKNITYDITLYGGLGEFLYNLSYDQTAEGSDVSRGGGEDRRLSSLVFYDETEPDKEFDFDITKETVAEAWEALEKGTGATKWQYINFAPAYNGYPKDFDADKVLINTQGSSCPVTYNNNGKTGTTANPQDKGGFPTVISQGDSTYRAYNNYAIGELPKEMTEWEMRDLRSYLQRPVMSMKGFIEAISNPINNGGYNVELDQKFFNEDNPYYAKAWFTLPQLKKDETETGVSAKTEVANNQLSISSQIGDSYDSRYYLTGLTPGAVYSGIDVTFSFKTTIAGMQNEVLTTAVDRNAGGLFAKDAGYYSCIFVQLVGEDENGNAIAASPIYNFTSPYGKQKGSKFIFGNEYEGAQTKWFDPTDFKDYDPVLVDKKNYKNCLGAFKRISGNNYVWYNKAGNQSAFTVSLTDKLEYHRVYFRVTKCYKWRDYKKGKPHFNKSEKKIFGSYSGSEETARNILMSYVPGGAGGYSIKAGTATTRSELVGSQVKYTVTSDIVRSGDHISKGQMLNFDGTPCDYLLSYCKLFNLYLSKDIYSNTIYIRTRDSFYNGGTIDLDKFIDRSKEISVKPLAMDSRWYDFAYPEDEKCGAAEDYDFNYGVEYGKNKVQTTYEFDSSAVDLLKDNIYQNGVQVQESSKYYTLRTVSKGGHTSIDYGPKTVPTFLYNSIDYKLFSTPNDSLDSCVILPPSGYTQSGYTSQNSKEDWLPKLQLNNDNDPIDGTNVLCFYGGFKSSPNVGRQQTIYYLTDDVAEMYVLNGETPCWIWTKEEKNGNQQIAKGMTKLPVFSRMLYNTDESKIEYTWDFGRVRDTYVPVKAYEDKSTIYERWWADYISDLYDANTRVAEVYVKMEGKVVGDWLRAFYWWDNTYWVLTEINDYNITSYATTKCKFVRVNDLSNYTDGVTPPTAVTPTATLVPDKYMIAATGETISARVVTSDGGVWHIEYPSYVHPSQVAGTGDTTITLRFDSNPNSDGRDFDIGAYRTVGTSTHFWQQGTESVDKQISVSGNRAIFNYSAQTNSAITISYRNRGTDTVTINSDADWLTASQLSWNGESAALILTIEENTGTTVRSATVSISGSSLSTSVTIDQLPETITISNNGGSVTENFINPFTIASVNGYWANIRTSGNSITVSAEANTGNTTRYQTVNIVEQGNSLVTSASTQIVQAGGGGSLTVSPTAITADYTGGDKIMTVNATGNWSATSKPDWVTLSQSTGSSGQSTIIATFAENDGDSARTGSITITDGTRTATVNLTQNYHIVQNYLTSSPSAITYDYAGGNNYVNINSSGEWTVTSKPDWITLTMDSGVSGTSILGVSASTNTSTESGRTGNVVLSNGSTTLSIPVSQPAKVIQRKINVTPDSLYFDFTGNTKYITVASEENNWSVVSKPDWIVLSQTTGQTGYSMVSVTAPENTGSTTKTGQIIFTDGNFQVSVSVGQPASSTTKSLAIVPNLIYVENSGGTPILEIHYGNRNGDDVVVSSDQSWCSGRVTEWNGDVGYLVLNVANYGVNMERIATITVTGVLEPGLSATATVRQKELPYITLNPTFIEFEQTGGTASIILKSNTNWIIDITDTTND